MNLCRVRLTCVAAKRVMIDCRPVRHVTQNDGVTMINSNSRRFVVRGTGCRAANTVPNGMKHAARIILPMAGASLKSTLDNKRVKRQKRIVVEKSDATICAVKGHPRKRNGPRARRQQKEWQMNVTADQHTRAPMAFTRNRRSILVPLLSNSVSTSAAEQCQEVGQFSGCST